MKFYSKDFKNFCNLNPVVALVCIWYDDRYCFRFLNSTHHTASTSLKSGLF